MLFRFRLSHVVVLGLPVGLTDGHTLQGCSGAVVADRWTSSGSRPIEACRSSSAGTGTGSRSAVISTAIGSSSTRSQPLRTAAGCAALAPSLCRLSRRGCARSLGPSRPLGYQATGLIPAITTHTCAGHHRVHMPPSPNASLPFQPRLTTSLLALSTNPAADWQPAAMNSAYLIWSRRFSRYSRCSLTTLKSCSCRVLPRGLPCRPVMF